MNTPITDVSQLREEIERLRLKKQFQESELKHHFNSPENIFNTIRSLFSRPNTEQARQITSGVDVFSWLSKLLLPLTLNKTLFRKSNFIVKSLVALISKKITSQVDQKSIDNIWAKVKSIMPDTLLERAGVKKLSRKIN